MVSEREFNEFFNKQWNDIEFIISVIDSIEDGLLFKKPESETFPIDICNIKCLCSLKDKQYIPTLKKVLDDTIRMEEYMLSQRIHNIIANYDI